MAVPVSSIRCCVLNNHNFFYLEQNTLAFNRYKCCHLALCLHLIIFYYNLERWLCIFWSKTTWPTDIQADTALAATFGQHSLVYGVRWSNICQLNVFWSKVIWQTRAWLTVAPRIVSLVVCQIHSVKSNSLKFYSAECHFAERCTSECCFT